MKYRFLALLLLLAFAVARPAAAHDYHASIADVQFDPRTQTLQVAVRIFMDDLENILSRRTKTKVEYNQTSDQVQKHLADYLNTTLAFEVEKDKPIKHKFIGSEAEADVVWVYLEVLVKQETLTQLYVKNAILTELFSDQMNIVNINYKGKTESVLLQRGETEKKVAL
ncbi:DUF6702 family protein [Pontibacter akesuensis]|uniref:Uncharacterized protein n=1 Tax=Pontibacter akesuensis TaxID=388950 RepID=A0A1I7J958_9BACT|nr:DUF6702 family protein [Pontibacter akesuensis]GHA71657.1 hypothetical protein GCM10007389_26580 [Pontibacter akesuensis]SFU81713.1 hypothetical protein SAMN04487941_2605 [Pontibacter akesuensis]